MREFLPTPKSQDEAYKLAQALSKSFLVPKQFQGRADDVLVAMMWSYNLNIPFVAGLQSIAVINGKPCIYGDMLLAIVRSSGLLEDISESVEGNGDNQYAACTVYRKGQKSPIKSTFSVVDAKRALLWGKQGPWTQYPKRMLKMRARAYALRDAFSDVLMGLSLAEEQEDLSAQIAKYEPEVIRVSGVEAKPLPKKKMEEDQPPFIQDAEIVSESAHEDVSESAPEEQEIPKLKPLAERSAETYNLQVKQIKEAATEKDLVAIYRSMSKEEQHEFMQFFSERRKEIAIADMKRRQASKAEEPPSLKASEPSQQATSTNELL